MFRIIDGCFRHSFFLLSIKSNCNKFFQSMQSFSQYVTKLDQSRCLTITNGRKSTNYHYIWLRDHCRCDECYNNVTFQRRLRIQDIPEDIKPKVAHVEDNKTLKVIWEGGHKSHYSIPWLEECLYENHVRLLKRNFTLWTKNNVDEVPIARVDYGDLMESDSCLAKLISSLVECGVAFVERVPVSVEGTEAAARRIGPVKSTLFGGMWEFTDTLNHSDSAYTREALPAHTDNTYFTEAAGLQILHCLGHEGSGGETTLVDGFKGADILKNRFPEVYERFTKADVAAEYIEKGYHYVNRAPVIKINPITNDIEQIRFNVNDRAPVVLPQDQILQHYADLRILANILHSPELEWTFKLRPGIVLIVDNYRILHGRTSFTGSRRMCGCYLGRSDFLSAARVFKAIN